MFWKQVDLLGTTMGSPEDFRELCALCEAGQLRPAVDEVIPLAEVDRALTRMERAEHQGKIVLTI